MSVIQRVAVLFVIAIPLLGFPYRMVAQSTPATNAPYSDFNGDEVHFVTAIQADLVAEKFDDLDHLAAQLRLDKSRFPGGDWKLRMFYSALDAPQLTDKDSVEHIAHLENWMKLRPESITARVALATSLHRWAWVARGNGRVDTVPPEGWRLFNDRIQNAYTVLQGAANMATMCPQWYSEMMTVGLAQSWPLDRMRDIFARGIQFEPGYYYLYQQFAEYLLPKWHGHPGDSSAFAKSSADALSGDASDILYFQIAAGLIRQGNFDFPIDELDWIRIQRAYLVLTTQYGEDTYTKNQFAFIAWRYHDADTASRQFDHIGDDWSRNVWPSRMFFDRARDWSRAHRTAQ